MRNLDDLNDVTDPIFEAKVLENVETKPGCWQHLKIGVFVTDPGAEQPRQIGEYTRNYSAFYNTFHPFKQGGKWYALYSRDYTATRIMSLPDCQDLGGEEHHTFGFCPTGYYVPKLCAQDPAPPDDPRPVDTDTAKYRRDCDYNGVPGYTYPGMANYPEPHLKAEYEAARDAHMKKFSAWLDRNPHHTRYANWGFVQGCVWGDDSGGWKLEYLDLSKAAEGVVVRKDLFGYLQLPSKVDLSDAIVVRDPDTHDVPMSEICVEIALPVTYRMDGTRVADDS